MHRNAGGIRTFAENLPPMLRLKTREDLLINERVSDPRIRAYLYPWRPI
jgi:hypothetical protein